LTASAKIFKILYRVTLPGGLLLLIAVALIRVGALADSSAPLVRFVPLVVFAAGLALSAVFRRSRLFFALLAVAVAQTALQWLVPRLAAETGQHAISAIALLLPLNLLALAFMKERGIISPAGRKRLVMAALEIVAVLLLCLPQLTRISAQLNRTFVPPIFSDWSRLSQPALMAFLLALAVIMVPLIRRYKAVESSLFWSLLLSFAAFRAGASTLLAGIYFATAGLALIVALIETSYNMAYLDELTQLPSRRSLNEALLKLGENYTIAMLDVDHFKKFNDSYGHESGDQALRMVASRLSHIAGGGRAYRYGGEEFAVLFPGKPAEEVFVYLDRMRKIIEQSVFTVRGKDRRKGRRLLSRKKQTSVTVSIGVASSNGEGYTPAEVLRVADQALYRAKAKGRNCTVTAKGGKMPRQVETGMRILSVS